MRQEILESKYGRDDESTIKAMENLLELYRQTNQPEKAEAMEQRLAGIP